MNNEEKDITFESVEEYEECVQNNLHDGYEVADLKHDDSEALWGMGFMASEIESAFDNYCDNENNGTVYGKIKCDIAQEIWDEVVIRMISAGCSFVYSAEDDYGKYEGSDEG